MPDDPVTPQVPKHKFALWRIAGLCSLLILAQLMGCTRADQQRDASKAGATATQRSAEPKATTACELLTAAEVAGFLKVPAVHKDETNSGMNQITKVDICNWYVKEGSSEGIEFRLRRSESDDGTYSIYSAAMGEAVEHNAEREQKAQHLSGVGD